MDQSDGRPNGRGWSSSNIPCSITILARQGVRFMPYPQMVLSVEQDKTFRKWNSPYKAMS